MFAQFFVTTATWGLAAWEAALGLDTDISKSYEDRRTRILSKLLGQGATTKTLIQSIAKTFFSGDVVVTEYPSGYRFDIRMVGALGIPVNMNDLTAAVEEIKPAHLDFTFSAEDSVSAGLYAGCEITEYRQEVLTI